MGKNRLYRILSRIVNIKPGEEKLALLLFSCFFLITSPHTIIKALRTTDLLVKMGVGALPLAYISAAIVTGLVVLFHSKIRFRISNQFLIIASLVFFVISGLLLHLVLQSNFGKTSSFLPYFYWVWASVLIIVLLTHFWLIVNEVFNPREAKRLIGFCGSGGILGGVFGGLLAGFLTRLNLASLLLPLACGLLFACIFVVRAIFGFRQKKHSTAEQSILEKERPDSQKVGFKDSFDAVRKNSYLVLIAAIVVITVIVSTFIEFQFLSAADYHYANNAKGMQAFFGFFFASLTTFAFFLNIFLTGNFLRKFGIRITLLLTPAILLICSFGVLLTPFALLPAIFIKGSDESLAFSLSQAVREILYIPLASDLKYKAKPFIDMFINRFAKVMAALFLLIFALLLNKEVKYLTPIFDPGLAKNLSWGIIAFLVLWIVFGLKIGKEYVTTVKQNIKIKWDRADKAVAEKLDVDYAKLVFDTVESRSRSSVLYAMYLFDLLEQDKLSPEIKKMISQKAEEVTVSSLGDLFNAEGATWFPDIADDSSQAGLITDVREILSLDAYQQLMKLHVEEVMVESEKSEIEKMELAKVIGLMDQNAPLVDKLSELINDDSPEVSCYAIKSAARLQKEGHIPAIIHKLDNSLTKEDAINALQSYGHAAMSTLEECLSDNSKSLELRKAVVEVLARIGTQETVRALMEELDQGTEELDMEIIDALDRIHSEKADTHFPAQVANKKAFSLIAKYCQTFIDLQGLEPVDINARRRQQLERNSGIYFADIFKLLGLYYPHEDIVKAYQNLKTGTRDSVAYAIELLDNTLKKNVKDIILPLIEDLSPLERLRKFQKILRGYSEH